MNLAVLLDAMMGLFLFARGTAMKVEIDLLIEPEVEQWMEEIRMRHIDINPIIQEELQFLLPPYIRDIVGGVYGEAVK